MVTDRARGASAAFVRYGIVYPSIATGGAYVAATVWKPSFGTILFGIFAITIIVTGIGSINGSSSNDALQSGTGLTGTSTPGERWNETLLVKLALFCLGLAMVLTAHAIWWS